MQLLPDTSTLQLLPDTSQNCPLLLRSLAGLLIVLLVNRCAATTALLHALFEKGGATAQAQI